MYMCMHMSRNMFTRARARTHARMHMFIHAFVSRYGLGSKLPDLDAHGTFGWIGTVYRISDEEVRETAGIGAAMQIRFDCGCITKPL